MEAQFAQDGFEVLSSRIPASVVAQLHDEITAFVEHYDIENEQQIFRTDIRDRGNTETFLRSASIVHGFLESEAIDENDRLIVPRHRALNKLGHALHDHLPAFNQLARSSIIRDAFTTGGLQNVEIDQSMVIFKQPLIGGDVRWHQDATYLLTEPSKVVGIWIALEEATRENGCLWMAPTQHRSPLRERYTVDWHSRTGSLKVIDETPWPSDEESLPIEVEAGQIVVFHDHMPHRSFKNTSTRSRIAITFHGHDTASRWLPENWLHRHSLPPFRI